MVRKERLELSQPKLLEPKSSASTNSATPASLSCIFILYTEFFLFTHLVEKVAGIPGFEPGNGRIKTCCLTAWRYPNKSLIVLVLIKNMVRKERLELSQPKLLGPKSSASTNSATPASFVLKVLVVILNSSLSYKKEWWLRRDLNL